MPRTIIVQREAPDFRKGSSGVTVSHVRLTVPDGAKITFGPWSPRRAGEENSYRQGSSAGTLRVYESSKVSANILVCLSGVVQFVDENVGYEEERGRDHVGRLTWGEPYEPAVDYTESENAA